MVLQGRLCHDDNLLDFECTDQTKHALRRKYAQLIACHNSTNHDCFCLSPAFLGVCGGRSLGGGGEKTAKRALAVWVLRLRHSRRRQAPAGHLLVSRWRSSPGSRSTALTTSELPSHWLQQSSISKAMETKAGD